MKMQCLFVDWANFVAKLKFMRGSLFENKSRACKMDENGKMINSVPLF